ncbi:MAG: TolB family protein [Anaerolineales bacterium]
MSMPPKTSGRLIEFGLWLSLWAIVSGCSSLPTQELSFSGPSIEGVRNFHLVTPSNPDPQPIFDRVQGLGPVLQWSPDGETVLVEIETGQYHVADPDSGQVGNCISCAIPDARTVYYSPDGEFFAIGANSGLYLVDSVGGEPAQLADIARPGWIDWSPDGSKMLFSSGVSTAGSRRFDIYLYDLETNQLTNLTAGEGTERADFFSPRWSPDGTEIAFHSMDEDGFHLMLAQADGSDMVVLTDWFFRGEAFLPETAPPPQWSPNGKRLAYQAYDEINANLSQDIFVVDADGSNRKNLTRSPGFDSNPQWSSNGRWIAFVSSRDGNGEIYVMAPDGGNVTNVSNMPVTDELIPFWRP